MRITVHVQQGVNMFSLHYGDAVLIGHQPANKFAKRVVSLDDPEIIEAIDSGDILPPDEFARQEIIQEMKNEKIKTANYEFD